MRIPIIAGNWKMHKTVAEALELVRELRRGLVEVEGVEVVLCPAFVALAPVAELLKPTKIGLGAQNMFWEDQGAYTGEVSPLMLKDLVQYVILGHSERRRYFGETDEGVNRKVKAALKHGLTPIICVGENLEENEAGRTHAVVERQLRAALCGISAEQARALVIAYEPVWAIGTGKPATGAGANAVIGLTVRGVLADLYGEEVAQTVRVQYGGSVNPQNIAEFVIQPDIDGALVGGASLKAPDFIAIVRETAQAKGHHRR
ncbi:MAG: triose-phosphate isomerase [Chloroflexota bacterium]